MKPHIRKAKGNIDGRWIVETAFIMAWAANFAEACRLAISMR